MTAGPGSNSGPPDYIFVDKNVMPFTTLLSSQIAGLKKAYHLCHWSQVGPGAHWSGPDSACAAEGVAEGGKSFVGPKSSDAGEGAASPYRAKLGSGKASPGRS